MLAFNKLTGLYGILAILTGFELSLLQLSTYIYSNVVLILLAILIPHIKRQSPFECLALAWLYILDTLINCACTTFFAVQWYFSSMTEASGAPLQHINGTLPIDAAASSTSLNQWIRRSAHGDDVAMPHDTAFSFVLITMFTVVRVYFSLVVAAHAQQVLVRHHDRQTDSDRPQAKESGGPFAVGTDEGEGWRGKLGRAFLSLGRSYWLDHKDQEDWARLMGDRFRTSSPSSLLRAEV